jgi:hypothetical protein
MSRSSPPLRASYAHLYYPDEPASLPASALVPERWDSFWMALKDKEIQKVMMIFGAGVLILVVIEGIVKIVCLALSSGKKKSVVNFGGVDYVPLL